MSIIAKSAPHKWATLTLCAALLVYQLFQVVNGPIWRDDSVFSSVAKSIAIGNGYAAVYFDVLYPHHYGITTGPIQILPTALLISVFGNQHWIPKFVSVSLIWGIMLALYFAAGKYLASPREKWTFCFVFLMLALVFTAGGNNNFLIETGVKFSFWYLLLGQIQAGLTIVLGAFLLFGSAATRKTMFFGGFIVGLAILFKTLAAIGAVVCIAAAIVRTLFDKSFIHKEKFYLIVLSLVGAAAPLLGFEILKIFTMGFEAYLELQRQTIEYYVHAAVITSVRENKGIIYEPSYSKQVITLFLMVGFLTTFILIPITVYMLSASLRQVWPHRYGFDAQSNPAFIGLVLIGCFLAQALWWFRFSQPYSDRYMITAFIYLSAGIALILLRMPKSRFGKELMVLFFIVVNLEGYNKTLTLFFKEYAFPTPQLALQLSAAAEVEKLKKNNIPLYSCTTNFELEYLSSGSGNFKDCKELLKPEAGNAPAVLVSYYVEPNRIVVVEPKGRYYATFEKLSPEILAICPDVFAQYGRTEMRRCNGSASTATP